MQLEEHTHSPRACRSSIREPVVSWVPCHHKSSWNVPPVPSGGMKLQNNAWEETKTKAVDAVQFLAGAPPRVQGEEARREAEALDNQVCIRGPIADGLFYEWPHHPGVVGKAGMTDRNSGNGYFLPSERLVTTGFSYVFGEAPQNVTPLLNSVLVVN
eukprot:scaffold1619_cov184-Chaetoceros_neogracile.AAC.1